MKALATIFHLIYTVAFRMFRAICILLTHLPEDDGNNSIKLTEFEYRPVGEDGEMIQVAKQPWEQEDQR